MAVEHLTSPEHIGRWQRFLANCQIAVSQAQPLWPSGRLTRINGLVMEAKIGRAHV